jgi:hypothetical protein
MAVILQQENAAALLRSSGAGVLVNENPSPESIALFPDDLIETPKRIVARLEITGSAADISPETMVQFETDELALDHHSVSEYHARVAGACGLFDSDSRQRIGKDAVLRLRFGR